MYEPSAEVLAGYFLFPLPPWIPGTEVMANWQLRSWEV